VSADAFNPARLTGRSIPGVVSRFDLIGGAAARDRLATGGPPMSDDQPLLCPNNNT